MSNTDSTKNSGVIYCISHGNHALEFLLAKESDMIVNFPLLIDIYF